MIFASALSLGEVSALTGDKAFLDKLQSSLGVSDTTFPFWDGSFMDSLPEVPLISSLDELFHRPLFLSLFIFNSFISDFYEFSKVFDISTLHLISNLFHSSRESF